MSKAEFLRKWNNDYIFRNIMKNKGILVIQNNVIFLNEDGSLKRVAGNHVN